MTASNSWDQRLEEVVQSHESQIEQNLQQMIHSFEAHTFTYDTTSMSHFFDYLRFRLIAACRKIEVEYFARKAMVDFELNASMFEHATHKTESCRNSSWLSDSNEFNQQLKIIGCTDSDDKTNDTSDDDIDNESIASNDTLVGEINI